MFGINLQWPSEARKIGKGTVFTDCTLTPEIPQLVDLLIAAGQSRSPLPDLVAIQEAAEEIAFAFSLDGIRAGQDLAGVDPADIHAFWHVAINFGAAHALALAARRCAQLGTYSFDAEGQA